MTGARWAIASLLALIGVIGAWLLLRTFLWDLLAGMARTLLVLYLNFPQVYYWGLLLLVAAGLALYSLSGTVFVPAGKREEAAHHGNLRVQELTNIVRNRQHIFYKMRLNQTLTRLAISTLAMRLRMGEREVADALRAGTLDLPPDLQAYFRKGLQRWADQPSANRWQQIFGRPSETSSDALILKAIDFIEKELENQYDDRHF
ncbi:MAG TPA: hypothetical protein PKM21_09230 [Anaerolineales bacterium]|nr:hypothetical protein [Anaerolineales bacterium]